MAVTAGPYADPSAQTVESLTREVEYLRLVVSRFWKTSATPAQQSLVPGAFQTAG